MVSRTTRALQVCFHRVTGDTVLCRHTSSPRLCIQTAVHSNMNCSILSVLPYICHILQATCICHYISIHVQFNLMAASLHLVGCPEIVILPLTSLRATSMLVQDVVLLLCLHSHPADHSFALSLLLRCCPLLPARTTEQSSSVASSCRLS